MIRPRGDPYRLRLCAKWFQAAAARVEQLGLELRRHSEASSEMWLGWASFQFHEAMEWAENDCAETVTAFLAAGAGPILHRDAGQGPPRGAFARVHRELDEVLPPAEAR